MRLSLELAGMIKGRRSHNISQTRENGSQNQLNSVSVRGSLKKLFCTNILWKPLYNVGTSVVMFPQSLLSWITSHSKEQFSQACSAASESCCYKILQLWMTILVFLRLQWFAQECSAYALWCILCLIAYFHFSVHSSYFNCHFYFGIKFSIKVCVTLKLM